MQAQINSVTVALAVGDTMAQESDGIALEVEPWLRLPTDLATTVGVEVLRELAARGRVEVGDAFVTGGGDTNALFLIHAVSPRWGEGSERGKLMNVTRACLALADEHGIKSLALPAFSLGERGFPVESCVAIMLTEIVDFTFEDLNSLSHITVVCSSAAVLDIFRGELERQRHQLDDEAE